MKKKLLFKGLLTTVLLMAGASQTMADDAVTVTVKGCTYGYQMIGSSTTGEYKQTQNSNKIVAYMNNATCIYYLGTIDMTNLFSIEVKGAVLNPKSTTAQLRFTSFPENTYDVNSDYLSHKNTDSGYESTGLSNVVRDNSKMFLVMELATTRTDADNPRDYAGADFFVTDKGTALNGAYNGNVTFGSTASWNKINTSIAGTGNRQLFLYPGLSDGSIVCIDEVVFHYKDKATCTYDLEVSDAGYATLCLPYRANIPDGVTCYTLSYSSGDKATATEVTGSVLHPQTPVLVKAAQGKYTFTALKNFWNSAADNTLKANWLTKYIVPEGSYILTKKDGNVGFRKADGSTNYVNAFRCYLTPEVEPGAREFLGVDFEEETTGVENLTPALSKGEGVYFDLSGRRIAQPKKGLYIVNGKKVVIK